jgi:DNA-directed RNA polymerase II subunit RPB2
MKLIEGATTLYDVNVNYVDQLKRVKIIINGNLVAFADSIPKFLTVFRHCRKSGILSDTISVIPDFLTKEIRINTDAGRCMRPLLVV